MDDGVGQDRSDRRRGPSDFARTQRVGRGGYGEHVPNDSPGFSLPIVPRYAEVDQQGVVFNGHYLTWFDEACTAFLDDVDATESALFGTGHDLQVVHTEIDYVAPVRWRDAVRVTVRCERIGTTSFTLAFTVLHSRPGLPEQTAVRGRTVYVVVSPQDWAKRPVPDELCAALTGSGADASSRR
jgi:acyl-CoA thioester hydrolase